MHCKGCGRGFLLQFDFVPFLYRLKPRHSDFCIPNMFFHLNFGILLL
jgi:hypothetical protein